MEEIILVIGTVVWSALFIFSIVIRDLSKFVFSLFGLLLCALFAFTDAATVIQDAVSERR